jgi:hypothetical protein
LASSEVRQVSRRAREQWAQRDSTAVQAAGDVSDEHLPVRPPSPTTETVYGGASRQSGSPNQGTICRSCRLPIVGERYQCANCPSEPQAYNLVRTLVAYSKPFASLISIYTFSVPLVSGYRTPFMTPCTSSSSWIDLFTSLCKRHCLYYLYW